MIPTTLNFDAITNEDRGLFDDIQSDVLSKLQQTISTAEGVSGDDKAGQFVAYLTSYSPEKLENAGYGPSGLPWNMWKVFTYTAACIPPDHPAHNVLIQILLALQAAEAPWNDLPEFGWFMRDEWNQRPNFKAVDQPSASDHHQRGLSLDEWLNLNAFVARVYCDVEPSFRSFGIWELRDGLEVGLVGDATEGDEGKPLPQASVDTKVRVAAEWIIGAGDRLWKDSLLGVWAEVTETHAWVGGKLIPATRGMNLERWGFWKRRFAEVRDDVRDQAASDAVGRALEIMTGLEKQAAEAL
ncbi:hypothetical protein diail_6787 [Diaporthe ilicicola]|nr:hypothetical protein diail_6787 [Diaporthe ilicicola]